MTKARAALAAVVAALFLYGVPSAAAAAERGLYVSLFGGAQFLDSDLETDGTIAGVPAGRFVIEPVPGFVAGGALGYAIGVATSDWVLRIEAEAAYRQNSIDDVKDPALSLALPAGSSADGSIIGLSFLANAIAAYERGDSEFVPYLGGGIGAAFVSAKADGHVAGVTVNLVDDSDVTLAFQVIAGLEYKVTPNLRVGVEYRFFGVLDTDFDLNAAAFPANSSIKIDEFEGHAVFLRLTWTFFSGR